ncbi:MAG: hypothetical protein OQL19_03620 [Gammaproteobacteria bacterium]|nr:hypothetical protein [Gammaproteobacteria bacterium]
MNLAPISLQTIIGLIGISLLLSAILLRILLRLKLKKQSPYLFSVLFFAITFISFSGDSINIYVRGLLNDISITTLILLTYFFIQPTTNTKQTHPIFLIITIIGLMFYPLALGIGPIDPYSWGFLNKDHGLTTPIIFLFILMSLMLFAWIKNYNLLLLSLVLSVIVYQLELLESRNIWDYLFDPLIFTYALITTFVGIFYTPNK